MFVMLLTFFQIQTHFSQNRFFFYLTLKWIFCFCFNFEENFASVVCQQRQWMLNSHVVESDELIDKRFIHARRVSQKQISMNMKNILMMIRQVVMTKMDIRTRLWESQKFYIINSINLLPSMRNCMKVCLFIFLNFSIQIILHDSRFHWNKKELTFECEHIMYWI